MCAALPLQSADRGFAGIVADGKWMRERDLGEVGDYYALAIGIDAYKHWSPLRCAAKGKYDKEQRRLAIERAFGQAQAAAKAAEANKDYGGAITAYDTFLRSQGGTHRSEDAQRELTRLRHAKRKYEDAQYAGPCSRPRARWAGRAWARSRSIAKSR